MDSAPYSGGEGTSTLNSVSKMKDVLQQVASIVWHRKDVLSSEWAWSPLPPFPNQQNQNKVTLIVVRNYISALQFAVCFYIGLIPSLEIPRPRGSVFGLWGVKESLSRSVLLLD